MAPFESQEQVVHRVRSLLNLRIAVAKDVAPVGQKLTTKAKNGMLDNATKMARWKKLFSQYDKDMSGYINFKELRLMCRHSLHLSEAMCPDKELQLLFQLVDADGSGTIEFNEFCKYLQTHKEQSQEVPASLARALKLALARERLRTITDLRSLYERTDLNNDNRLSAYELSRFLRECLHLTQHEVSDFHIKKLHKALDVDCSGAIEISEFFQWVQTVQVKKGDWREPGLPNLHPMNPPAAPGSRPERLSSAPAGAMRPGSTGSTVSRAQSEPGGGPSSSTKEAAPRPLPAAAGGPRRTYLSIPGAERLNHIEQRLFEAGFDIRGGFFKASDLTPTTSSSPGTMRKSFSSVQLQKVAGTLL